MNKIVNHRYRILQPLGRGSFGETYLAEDLKLHLLVAVKISVGERDNQVIRRFNAEANVLAKVMHPNVVAFHKSGITDDGKLYLVTEYIKGKTLFDILSSDGQLTLFNALLVTNAVATGLHQIHKQNIIHRDIKSHNVIIPQGSDELLYHRAKIMDFGLAGVLETNTKLTMGGELIGTPVGVNFNEFIATAVSKCKTHLLLIGSQWLGNKRLENPNDFVRIEAEAAIAANIPLIGVIGQGARLPHEDELPTSLAEIAYCYDLPFRLDSSEQDINRLIKVLEWFSN